MPAAKPTGRVALPWPAPALLVWALAWTAAWLGAWANALAQGLAWLGLAAGLLLSLVGTAWGSTRWRRFLIAMGFPLSLTLLGMVNGNAPAWLWLLPLLLLLLLYPINAWRDAPLFPTPLNALHGMSSQAPLPEPARVLDAGCGLGDGLRALRQAYPQAQLHGVEWSWPLRALCALRCPWAQVRQGDIWCVDWSPYQMVYLFQRPESMARAVAKARAQLQPGAWLVSLEFEAPDLQAHAVLTTEQGRKVWLYQQPLLDARPKAQKFSRDS